MRKSAALLVLLCSCKLVSKKSRDSENASAPEASSPTPQTTMSQKKFLYLRIELAQKSALAREFEFSSPQGDAEILQALMPDLGCTKGGVSTKSFDTVFPSKTDVSEIKAVSTTGFAQGDGKMTPAGQFVFAFNMLQYNFNTWDISLPGQPINHVAAPAFFKSVGLTQTNKNIEIWNVELLNPAETQQVDFKSNMKFIWEINNSAKNSYVTIIFKSKNTTLGCVFNAEKINGDVDKNLFSDWSDPEISVSVQLQSLASYQSQKLIIASYDWRYGIIKP